MPETRMMHFVPQVYLKHFSKEQIKGNRTDYFINALSMPFEAGTKIKSINIRNICVEKDIYKLNGSTEDKRQYIETMYHLLYESGYDRLYELLTDDTRMFVTPKERDGIISFVVSMFYRNNYWNRVYNNFMDNLYERAYHQSKASGHNTFFFGDEEISIEGKSLQELQKEKKIKDRSLGALTSAQKIFELTRARKVNDAIMVIKLNAGHEFITCDNPVTCRNSSGQHVMPIDPTNTLSLPINNNYLVQLMFVDDTDIDKTMIGRIPSTLMSGINSAINNQLQMAQADRFLLGTENALKKFQQNPNAVSIH